MENLLELSLEQMPDNFLEWNIEEYLEETLKGTRYEILQESLKDARVFEENSAGFFGWSPLESYGHIHVVVFNGIPEEFLKNYLNEFLKENLENIVNPWKNPLGNVSKNF